MATYSTRKTINSGETTYTQVLSILHSYIAIVRALLVHTLHVMYKLYRYTRYSSILEINALCYWTLPALLLLKVGTKSVACSYEAL